MIAIRLSRKNYHRIRNESPIEERDLEVLIDQYDTLVPEAALYFIPQSMLAHELGRYSWMTLPRWLLDEQFKFDESKIDDQFVEITQK